MQSATRSDGKIGLSILQESPLDQTGWKGCEPSREAKKESWVKSRYNVRATTDDGRLILWNTLSRAMSVFKPEQVAEVTALLREKALEAGQEGLAGYLFERGFLVREGTNEYRQFLLKFGQQHYRHDLLELILMSSEDCNFRCKYCYEEFARGTMLPEVRQGIKRLVERRIDHLRGLKVSWFGGEPLYGWPAIAELGPFFKEITDQNSIEFGCHMTTNGYLLTPDVVDNLFAWNIRHFQITLDGGPDTHDCSRPTRDGQGTFWTIFENLRLMSQRTDDFTIALRVNFDQTNHDRIEELLDLIQKEMKSDSRFHFTLHPVGQWGSANDDKLQVCGADEQKEVVRQLKEAAYERGIHFATLRDINRFGSQVCYAARPYNFLIGASGKVMKCTIALDMHAENVVGEIKENGDLILDDDRMALWTEPAFERDTQCQKCVVLPNCQGISCPLPRVFDGERACVSTRTGAKKELLEALAYPKQEGRVRRLHLDGRAPVINR